jgi:hypothetical protein
MLILFDGATIPEFPLWRPTVYNVLKHLDKTVGRGNIALVRKTGAGIPDLVAEEAETAKWVVRTWGPRLGEWPKDIERVYLFHDQLGMSPRMEEMVRRFRQQNIWVCNVRSNGAMMIAV